MDIRQWLEHTADREPPDPSDDIGFPGKFRNDRPVAEQVGRSYRHKRKRAGSDSSIIVPPEQSYHRKAEVRARSSSPNLLRQNKHADGVRRDRESSNDTQSRHESAPAKAYERRARHKTRTDRYVPKAKKQKRETEKRKEDKGHRKRRKSQRIGDGGRTAGLVQSFQLKNGPKNDRLTLKPDTSAGLFKHGRASMQMAGRGSGLPDLVFNEMRFLQKPTEHQDETQGVEETRKSKTKDPGRDQGQEISAYFNAKTCIVPEPPEDGHERQKLTEKENERHRAGKRSNEANLSRPVVELPEKPFLGFGSRGTHPPGTAGHDSTSYYSWSKSAGRRSSPLREHQTAAPTYGLGQGLAQHPPGNRRRVIGKLSRNLSKDGGTAVARDNVETEHGHWIQTRRARGPSIVKVYQPLDPSKGVRRKSTSVTKTTSQSLPRHPSSPPLFNKRIVNDPVAKARESSSYHTSEILQVHGQPMNRIHTSHPQRLAEHFTQDKENHDPQSSLSIDKVIRKAIAAAQTPHIDLRPQVHVKEAEIKRLPNIRRMQSVNDLRRHDQLNYAPRLRGFDTEEIKYPGLNQPRWLPATTHRPLSKTERQHWGTAAIETLRHTTPKVGLTQRPPYFNEGDHMLDQTADEEVMGILDENKLEHNHHEHDALYHHHFTSPSGTFEAQLNGTDHHIAGRSTMYESQVASVSGPIRGNSIENEIYGEILHERQDSPVDDGLAGFWKPNILY